MGARCGSLSDSDCCLHSTTTVPSASPPMVRIVNGMGSSVDSPTPAPAPSGSFSAAVRRVKWWILAAVVALVMSSLSAVVWARQHHPATFDYDAYSSALEPDCHPGDTLYVGVTFPDPQASGWVRIHSADPHGLTDSTGADFSYFRCTRHDGGLGNSRELPEECSAVLPAFDAKMSLKDQQLIVAITPDHPGRLVFHGIDLNYTDGGQTGTQQVGVTVQMRVIASD